MNTSIKRVYQCARNRGFGAMLALAYGRNAYAAQQMGWDVSWEADSDADLSFVDTWEKRDADSQRKRWEANPPVCEGAVLRNEDGEHLDSLWGIIDADSLYRREIEWELFSNADAWNIYQQLPEDAMTSDPEFPYKDCFGNKLAVDQYCDCGCQNG